MEIVFLDADTLGDISLETLRFFGKLTTWPVTSVLEIQSRIEGAEVVIVNKVKLRSEHFKFAPKLKLILVAATGTDNVDLVAAKEHGIAVYNVSGYSSESVAQHTLAMLLNLTTNMHRYAYEASEWAESPIFTRLTYPTEELFGKMLGIAGAGRIGGRFAEICQALGMKVQRLARAGSENSGPWTSVDEETFFGSSDVISLHCPLNETTREMINSRTLGMMRQGTILLNSGRGGLINEGDLANALRSGQVRAGLDVLSVEPPPPDHPLLAKDLPGLLITPHTAWTTREARIRLLAGLVGNLQSFLDGKSDNQVA